MRWQGNRSSSNIEDRRGMRAAGAGPVGGMLRLLPLALRFLGFKGTVVVVLGLLGYSYFTGGDLTALLSGKQVSQTSSGAVQQTAAEKKMVQFVSVVLADTEDTWRAVFKKLGKQYVDPKLVLYRGMVKSACGTGRAAMGPFYCPGDQKVYIDLQFYQDLKQRYKAPGDFAQAYVIAHEIGHHVQTLLGISAQVNKARKGLGKTAVNALSVRQELQADCFAGVWAFHANRARYLLESGDVEEGLVAASAIGDDRLQKQSQGYVIPESFTHGTSAQRVKWFKTGLENGTVTACETFRARTS